jgi:hypothetical protein
LDEYEKGLLKEAIPELQGNITKVMYFTDWSVEHKMITEGLRF